MSLKSLLSIATLAVVLGLSNSVVLKDAKGDGKAEQKRPKTEMVSPSHGIGPMIKNIFDDYPLLKEMRAYSKLGIKKPETIQYLMFLGITPERIKFYVDESEIFETAQIIHSEYGLGKLSPSANEVFDHYNIKHPERYNMGLVQRLMDSMNSRNDKPGLFIFLDEGVLQQKAEEERIALDFSENIRTGASRSGYNARFSGMHEDMNMLIFELEKCVEDQKKKKFSPCMQNKEVKDNIEKAKDGLEDYSIGNLPITTHGEDSYGMKDPAYRVIDLFFSERALDNCRLILKSLSEVSMLKEVEMFAMAGIADEDLMEYLKMFGFTSDYIEEIIKKEEPKLDLRDGNMVLHYMPAEQKAVFQSYDITNPWGITPRVFVELKENMNGVPEDGKPLAMVVLGYDPDGFTTENVEGLLEGYNMIVYEGIDADSAIENIVKVGEKYGVMDLLWIYSHAGRDGIAFAGEYYYGKLGVEDVSEIKRIKPYFYKNSIIVLEGCNTAKGGRKANNISRQFHDITGAVVYGTTDLTSECLPVLGDDKLLKDVVCDGKETVKF